MFVRVKKTFLNEYNLVTYVDKLITKNDLLLSVGQLVNVDYLDICDDEIQQRSFMGICIKIRRRVNGSMFVLRNNFKQEVIDQSFSLNSPLLINVRITSLYKKKASLYKLYHLSIKKS
jgi:ribosomal protein L19